MPATKRLNDCSGDIVSTAWGRLLRVARAEGLGKTVLRCHSYRLHRTNSAAT
jgi:hypothetical protein